MSVNTRPGPNRATEGAARRGDAVRTRVGALLRDLLLEPFDAGRHCGQGASAAVCVSEYAGHRAPSKLLAVTAHARAAASHARPPSPAPATFPARAWHSAPGGAARARDTSVSNFPKCASHTHTHTHSLTQQSRATLPSKRDGHGQQHLRAGWRALKHTDGVEPALRRLLKN